MYIKAISSTIPGINPKYGSLYPTKKILEDILLEGESIDLDYIEKRCGIRSVALTHDTLEAVRTKNPHPRNNTLYEMLNESVGSCVQQVLEKQSQKSPNIKFHIHVVVFREPLLEFRLKKIRKNYGFSGNVSTLFIEQGCSGFLEALSLCKILLASDKDADILVTAENNMSTYIYDRYSKYASSENRDNWIFQTLFGEGVGALIIGNNEHLQSGCFWKVEHSETEIVCQDWRVSEISRDGRPSIFIKATQVRETYLSSIPFMLKEGIKRFQNKDVISYILHESNPKILKKVVEEMGLKNVPTISANVGTLACVSAFASLEIVNIEQQKKKCYNSIVMALIGETHGNILAGYACLTPFSK